LERAEGLEQLRWIENGYKIKVNLTDFESIAIDVPDDLKKLTKFL
jgi:3-deoxy-manno-octulosonate cytidylyltransferase (CMP-KDO synthetase)